MALILAENLEQPTLEKILSHVHAVATIAKHDSGTLKRIVLERFRFADWHEEGIVSQLRSSFFLPERTIGDIDCYHGKAVVPLRQSRDLFRFLWRWFRLGLLASSQA